MQAHVDTVPESPPPALADALGLLRAVVADAPGGVALVDGRGGAPRFVYANDSFRALGQCAEADLEDWLPGDVPGLGPELEKALADAAIDGSARHRCAIRQGASLQALLVSADRLTLAGTAPWYTLVVRESQDSLAIDASDAEEGFVRAAAAAGDGYWDWNLVTGGLWFGPRFREMLGYAGGGLDATFASFQSIVHADERPRVLQAIRLHLEQRRPFTVEARLRHADGAWRWYRMRGGATRDPAGRPLFLSGKIVEVTELHRREERLRYAEDFLRRTLDALDVAVGVVNAAGELVEINRAWREHAGDRALVGMRYGFGEHYARLCRAAAERCTAGPAAAEGVEQVLRGEREAFTLGYAVADEAGERLLQMRVRALDVDGARGAIVTHDDVTELESAHQAVRETKEFYELILDSVPLHIAYVNRWRELVYANRCYEEWFQLPLAALQGRRLEQVTSAENYRQIAPRVEAVMGGRTVDFTTRGMHGTEERELAVAYLPHVVDGEVTGFFSVARDVTSQRRLETELRHAQKMEAIGQLTGGIAHDFNNLLSIVIGNLQLLERGLPAEPRMTANVATALRAALRGADLTKRLLAFARQQVLEPRVVAPARLVTGMRDLVKRTLGPLIEVGTQVDADVWSVFVDAAQLESSVLNLAINARDAMPGGGRLTLVARNWRFAPDDPARHPKLAPGDYVEVAVSDTGVGMTTTVAKRAFEPFFTTKEIGKGTGLGLAMVYGFAEQSGGLATIDSGPGRGTRVSLWFPRSQLTAGGAEPEQRAGELPRGTETVLVVEDDADVRATAASALRVLGYRVLEAGSAEPALALLGRDAEVALLLCDLLLPGGMDGLDLAREARRRWPRLRVLHTAGVYVEPALGEARDVLYKPYAISDLARRLRVALDGEKDDA